MDKQVLVQQLRQRQYAQGLLSKSVIDAVSDDDIIDSYITCSRCCEKQVTPLQLEAILKQAQDAYHFLTMCDTHAHEASRGHIQLPTRLPKRASWRRKGKHSNPHRAIVMGKAERNDAVKILLALLRLSAQSKLCYTKDACASTLSPLLG